MIKGSFSSFKFTSTCVKPHHQDETDAQLTNVIKFKLNHNKNVNLLLLLEQRVKFNYAGCFKNPLQN